MTTLRDNRAAQFGVSYTGIFRKEEKSGLGGAVRPGQEGVVLYITEDNSLRSEYLAWASPYFAFKQTEEYYFYSFQVLKKRQMRIIVLDAKHLLPAERSPKYRPKRTSPGPSADGRENCIKKYTHKILVFKKIKHDLLNK